MGPCPPIGGCVVAGDVVMASGPGFAALLLMQMIKA